MSNDYFVAAGTPSTGSQALSSTMRAEFSSIEDGFDKLPALSGNANKIIVVNAGATALSVLAPGTGVSTWIATPSSANLAAAITDETGSGALVFATSPTLTTPTLGVASATSINKVAITAPATSATLTIADGKTLTASNTITLTATDGSTLAIGTGGTLGSAAYLTGIASTYTPTITNSTNLSASTASECRHIRIGNNVFVSGYIGVTATAAALMQFFVSLPIASTTGDFFDVGGSGSCYFALGAAVAAVTIYADTADNRARFTLVAPGTNAGVLTFAFGYTVA